MKALLRTALGALPPLLGVMLGIRAFTGGLFWIAIGGGLVLLPLLSLEIGRRLMHRKPVMARWFIEIWVLSAIGVLALATAFGLWLGLAPLPGLLGVPAGDEATKAVTGAFAGAVATYVAVIWTKDILESKGLFSPATQFRAAMSRAHKHLSTKPTPASPTYEAVFEDTVAGEGRIDWDFSARGRRAEILAAFIGSAPPGP